MWDLKATLDPLTGAALRAELEARSAPRPATEDGPYPRNPARRRADAFCDLLDGARCLPDPVPPALVLDLACDADIVPVVLGGKSEPLDVGRSRYVVPVAIRPALTARDAGCSAPGCERPSGWCDADHIRHWANGGENETEEPDPGLQFPPPHDPSRRLGHRHR